MRQPRRHIRRCPSRSCGSGARSSAGRICAARLGTQTEAAVLAGQETRSPSFKKVGEFGTPPVCGLGE